jgi:hypothetical protein
MDRILDPAEALMNVRAAGVIGACIIVAALLHAWLSGASSSGRYQAVRSGDTCVVLDTRTGRMWEKYISSHSGPSDWSEATGPWTK